MQGCLAQIISMGAVFQICCCATVTLDIRCTNSLNYAGFVIYQFKNVNEVWERSSR